MSILRAMKTIEDLSKCHAKISLRVACSIFCAICSKEINQNEYKLKRYKMIDCNCQSQFYHKGCLGDFIIKNKDSFYRCGAWSSSMKSLNVKTAKPAVSLNRIWRLLSMKENSKNSKTTPKKRKRKRRKRSVRKHWKSKTKKKKLLSVLFAWMT